MKRATIGFMSVVLSGCGATPQMTYLPLRENPEGYEKITLPRSSILVRTGKESGAAPEVISVPIEDYPNRKTLLMRGETNIIQDTNYVNVTKIDNTDIVT